MNPHQQAIKAFYGNRRAERSQVPLMAHIEEGLAILEAIGAAQVAKDAFCLHPLVQSDSDLQQSLEPGSALDAFPVHARAVALAMEYRAVANSYLSHHCTGPADKPSLSRIAEVNQMLVADKVQNRKDFERYHLGSHPNSAVLSQYFANWLAALGISEDRYQELAWVLSQELPPNNSSKPTPLRGAA